MANLFSDNFNRADSATVGGSWTERDTPGYLSIYSNKLRLNGGADANGDIRAAGTSIQHGGVKISFTLEIVTRGAGSAIAFGMLGASGGTTEYRNMFGAGIFPRSSGGTVQFMDGSTGWEGSATACTLSAGTTYNVELLIFQDWSRELRVWAVGGTRPVAPTASIAAKTPTAAGTDIKIGYDNGDPSTGDYRIDDFAVDTIQTKRCLKLASASSQYAKITDASQTGLDLTGDMTLEAWIKFSSLPTNGGSTYRIIGKDQYDAISNRQYTWYAYNDGTYKFGFGAADDSNMYFANVAMPITPKVGVWYHVVLVFDIQPSSKIYCYMNGKKTGDGALEANISAIHNTGTDFMIGGRKSNSTTYVDFFDGKIKEARVWSDIRTDSEIWANAGKELVGNEANLVGYWKFDGDYLDMTANNNDLTAGGSPVFVYDAPFENTIAVSNSTKLLDRLISWWTLDETSGTRADSHRDNDLTDYGTTGYATGKKSNAADFEISNSNRLAIADASQVGLDIAGSMTISGWVKFESQPVSGGSELMIASKWNSAGNQRGYRLSYYNNAGTKYINFMVSSTGADSLQMQLAQTFADATWYHIVASYDATSGICYFYVNGVLVGTASGGSASIYNCSTEFNLGAYGGGGGEFMDGLIDELGIYAKSADYGEVLDLYKEGNAITYVGTQTFEQAVTATAAASLYMADVATLLKVLQVTGFSHIAQVKMVPKTISVQGRVLIDRIKDFYKNLTVTSSAGIVLAASRVFLQAVTATASAVADITAQKVKLVELAVSALATTSVSMIKYLKRTISATSSAVVTTSRALTLTHVIEVTAAATASIVKGLSISMVLAVTAVGTATTGITKALSMAISAVSSAIASLVRDFGYTDKYPRNEAEYEDKYPTNSEF